MTDESPRDRLRENDGGVAELAELVDVTDESSRDRLRENDGWVEDCIGMK